MALVSIDLKPSNKKLREFGDVGLAMLNTIGILLYLLNGLRSEWLISFCIAGLVLYILSRISPLLIKPFYLILIIAGYPIGWLLSHIVLALFYYGILTPLGIVFKIIGRDALCRQFKGKETTYWQHHKQPKSVKQYLNQF